MRTSPWPTERHLKTTPCWTFILCAMSALVGCGKSDPPPFRLNMPLMVSNQIVPAHQQAIADILGAMFGTPDEPFVLPETGLDLNKLSIAAGPVWSDEQGGKHGLYRRHCVHCHGVSGDGRGPTALFLNPYPRDYRDGVYKFKSTFNPAKPTDDDLHTILINGIPGTAMPSFALLPPDEVAALVEYVKYLSMRGQMETALVNYVVEELDFDPLTGEADPFDIAADAELREVVTEEFLADVVEGWEEAPEQVILPSEESLPPSDRSPEQIADSAAKGRALFAGTRANCIKCHGPTALGDGQRDDHNIWDKANVKFQQATEALAKSIQSFKESMSEMEGETLEEAKTELNAMRKELAERDDILATFFPPRNAIPRNLRQGLYRGGRRPLDLYRRFSAGIAGTPMPGGGPITPGAKGTLSDEEIWQIVDYVRSLPFEPASQPQRLHTNQGAIGL